MFTNETFAEIEKAASQAGIERAALLAVAEIESGGRAYALIGGRKEPLIRFEGHYFDRRLVGAAREQARRSGLSSPETGAIANPASQPARWKMLERAATLNRKAAYESVSWGIGQVMGAHWAWLGYASADALVAEARSGVEGQMRLMIHYIVKAGLADALTARDWDGFARGYNGPAYRRYGYHTRLAAAYRKHAGGRGTVEISANGGMLQRGDSGEAVRNLQIALAGAGYPLRPDGRFGPLTDAALRKFQRDRGLAIDGIAGPRTLDALRDLLSIGQRLRRWWMRVRTFLTDLLTQRGV
jgi:murein L,D-transpeptidase YcbB/YkuD